MSLLLLYCAVACWLTLVYTLKFDLEKRELAEKDALLLGVVNGTSSFIDINGTTFLELPVYEALTMGLISASGAAANMSNTSLINLPWANSSAANYRYCTCYCAQAAFCSDLVVQRTVR